MAIQETASVQKAAVDVGGATLIRRLLRHRNITVGAIIIGALVLTAIFAPLIAPYDPLQQNLLIAFQAPSAEHLFGTDEHGRDILSRVIYGSRLVLLEIVLAVGLAFVIGVPIGIVAGYYGGPVDRFSMWFMDVLFAFPGILFAILIVSVLGSSLFNMLLAIAIFSVPVYARLGRNLTLVVKQMEFVEAAIALGASGWRIMLRHILRNGMAPLLVQSTLSAGGVVLTAASLSFLGLGVRPPTPEWGLMISNGRDFVTIAPHISLFPGLAMTLVVLGFNLLGDGLRDLLDPRFRV